jgi:hypothetical protein
MLRAVRVRLVAMVGGGSQKIPMNKVMADIRNQSENPQAARDLLSAAADGQGRNHCHVPFTQASYSAGALPLRDAASRSSDMSRDIMINNSLD